MKNIIDFGKVCPTFMGNGAVDLVGAKAKELNVKKLMIVTDEGIRRAGVVDIVEKHLKEAGIDSFVFDKVMPNPTDEVVNQGGQLAKDEKFDGIIGLGGGSCMDAAKGIAILGTNPHPVNRYYRSWDYNKPLPLLLIPTTTGTGSENTKFAVITIAEENRKDILLCIGDFALCDPELTYDLPAHITASTGMDAFAHAAEALTVKDQNYMANIMAVEAIKRIAKWLPIACEQPHNAEARYNMMVGSNLAGLAITTNGCHIGHACSEAMGATFHVPHGISCAWGLPSAMAYAAQDRFEQVKIVADALDVMYTDTDTSKEVGNKVADNMRNLMKRIKIQSIKEYGLDREKLIACADLVLKNSNYEQLPTPMSKAEVENFLASLYDAYQ